MENKTWVKKEVKSNGEGGEEELAGHSPGVHEGGRHQGHHQHRHDALLGVGEGGGGASWHHLEGSDRDGVRCARSERDKGLPDTRREEEGSADHLPGRVAQHHHHGLGGAGAGARGGEVQTWKERIKLFLENETERGLPQTVDTDRSSSNTTFPPISSKEGRQDEEGGRCQVRKKETDKEGRRQESGRRAGYRDNLPSTNICIDRLSEKFTYRGGGEAERARGSRKQACGPSSASLRAPRSPGSSSSLVEQVTRSPLIGRRSPSPVDRMAG